MFFFLIISLFSSLLISALDMLSFHEYSLSFQYCYVSYFFSWMFSFKYYFWHCWRLLVFLFQICVPFVLGSWWHGQDPLPMRFSRQKYWSGLPFPTPQDLPDLGIEHASFVSPVLSRRILYQLCHLESPKYVLSCFNIDAEEY